ncbi:hypothetical protein [Pseudoclavibacter soli]|uniref:hypothetical protein n=1 Tax=Pseudoclavibacter soli TaxID=452623 RepID=UPI0012EB719E|nr:hypothetical protein [Pseudoclavibacter soli]
MSTPLASGRPALARARRVRAEHLLAVDEGLLSIDDVIRAAMVETGRPLRRITLRQLLLAQRGVGQSVASDVLDRLGKLVSGVPARPNIGWLLDGRAGGTRLLCFLDARFTGSAGPHAGWPYQGRR